MEEEHPGLRVLDGLDELIVLEPFLLDSGMVTLDAEDCLCTLFQRKEMRRERAIWEEKPNHSAEYECRNSSDDCRAL